MIDTIVLLLPSHYFTITQLNKFTPSAQFVYSHTLLRAVQNPLKQELKNGVYKPRLTLLRRADMQGKQDVMLKIECSLPKLLLGNNFEELCYKDFAKIIELLQTTLIEMGVQVSTDHLIKADVIAIHYAKNIVLTDGSTPYGILKKIKQYKAPASLDVNQTDYRNDGHAFKWHCNGYEVVFYDKIQDLGKAQKSSKRAIESDNEIQLHLFKKIQTMQYRKKFEMLRMEVRLSRRQKMQQLLSKLNITTPLTFDKLFKPAISKKVLLHYVDLLQAQQTILFDFSSKGNDVALFAALVVHNPGIAVTKIIQMFGLKKILESLSIPELKIMLKQYNQRTLDRLFADAYEINIGEFVQSNVFEELRRQIEKGKVVKL